MCEYLAGSLRIRTPTTDALKKELKAEAQQHGYYLQLDDEISLNKRKEILRIVSHEPPSILFNITTKSTYDCIDETLNNELEYFKKKPFEEIAFFKFVRRIFTITQPEKAVIIFVEGAETGWFPLKKRECLLNDFLAALYEFRDRHDYDVEGIYNIVL